MTFIYVIRNKSIKFIYKIFLKRIFFLWDPELVHDSMINIGKFLGKYRFLKIVVNYTFNYSNPSLEQEVLGIKFKNPVGLSGGFDKNAELTQILPAVGFGFEEVGSITGEECFGNPKPRLWRLKKSNSLQVYYGLKNDGCERISNKLINKNFKIPIGINLAKTNSRNTVDTEDGIKDYLKAYNYTKDIGNYFTINISCPNTYGGEPFTDPNKLDSLLSAIDKARNAKPIFIKLSPDLSYSDLDKIIAICDLHKIEGFICTNLTKKIDNQNIKDSLISNKGGLSGKLVEKLSNDLIRYIYKKTKGKYIIVGVGGIFSSEDAYEKIKNGASLVQLITGMIFEGPEVISDINIGLVKLLHNDGYKNINEVVGVNCL